MLYQICEYPSQRGTREKINRHSSACLQIKPMARCNAKEVLLDFIGTPVVQVLVKFYVILVMEFKD